MKVISTLVLLSVGTAAVAAEGRSSSETGRDIIATLDMAGYAEIRDVEGDDGLWEADVRGEDGRWYDVHVVPGSREILDRRADQPLMTADAIVSLLEAEGYTNVHDLDLDDAVWEVDANAPDGTDVDLKLNGFDGTILVTERDD